MVKKDGDGAGTVESKPPGIDCGATCPAQSAQYNDDTPVTLTAKANESAVFKGWGGPGVACPGIGSCTVTLKEDTTVTATFESLPPNQFNLTVEKKGNGAGTVESKPPGIDCGATCPAQSAQYNDDTPVTLTAKANESAVFKGWGGPGVACPGIGSCTVTLKEDTTVTATFESLPPNQFNLTVEKKGNGAGTVESKPPGIDCGATCPAQSAQYNDGTPVTLTAKANESAVFKGWGGPGVACPGTGPCTVTPTENTTVTATFTLKKRQLTVTKAGAGAGDGTVESSETPDGIACGATCSALYDHGTLVTLTTATNASAVFTGWRGGDCSGTGSCIVTMTQNITVTATFARNMRPLAKAGPDREEDESLEGLPNTVTLDGSASMDPDPDGTIERYRWRQTEGPLVVLADEMTARPTFTAPIVGGLEAFAPGDLLLGFVLSPSPGGVSPESQAHRTYADGQWTVMFTRSLRTPDADREVQFDFTDPANTYLFSIAYLDNTGAAPPLGDAAAVMSTQDTRAYTLGNASSGVDLRAVQETPRDCSAFTGAPMETRPANPSVVPALTLRAAYDSANVYLCVEAPDPNGQAEADVRFLIDGAVPSHCPGETCAPAVLAALIGERLTFELTVTDDHGLRSAPDSVTITVRDTDHDEDSDGVRDTVENGAPNNGDGNNDGILDSLQPQVTSLPNTGNQGYITLVSPAGTALADVRFLRTPPAEAPTHLRFPWGFLVFTVLDVPPGDAVTVTLLPPPKNPLAADALYYKFGPTPGTPKDHLYEFTFDGTTGAEIFPDRIQLHLIDGAQGDDDLVANGRIEDPGAMAIAAPPLPNVKRDGGGGGGCSILRSDQRTHSRPGDALGNILLPVLAMLILYGWGRITAQPALQRFFRTACGSKPPGVDDSGGAVQRLTAARRGPARGTAPDTLKHT